MRKDLQQAWDHAFANPGEAVDIGRAVVCDFCTVDYTDSNARGGVIWGSYAICPRCVHKVIDEPERIRGKCRDGETFADFVRDYRGSNSFVRVSADLLPRF